MNELNGLKPEWIQTATDVKCDECGSIYFKKVMRIIKVSRLVSGQPKDIIQPVGINACANCGHVNVGFDPIDDFRKISPGI